MIYQLPYNADLAIKAIKNAKEGYFCEVAKKKKPRSNNQNRYYWGIVVKMFSQEIGQIDDETHQDLAKHFLSYENNGKKYTKSTKQLTTIEFEDYLEKCRILASKHYGLYLPLPNECTEDIYKQLENHRI